MAFIGVAILSKTFLDMETKRGHIWPYDRKFLSFLQDTPVPEMAVLRISQILGLVMKTLPFDKSCFRGDKR